MEFCRLDTGDIHLHCACSGPERGPLVILLHGFPEFWYGWRAQIGLLAAAGYRVLAPDLRGYNLSDKPGSVQAYRMERLIEDVLGLLSALGRERATLVGHDWGGAVAWQVALRHPERLEKLAVLNIPHPMVMGRTLRTGWTQRLRSWYILFFQIPVLPELLLGWGNRRGLAASLSSTSHPGTFTDENLDRYREAWSQPGALSAMLNWYRALLRYPPRQPASVKVRVPTLLIWGGRDRFLGAEMAEPSVELCETGRLMRFPQATHWVQHEEAEPVNQALLDFLHTSTQ